MGDSFQRGVDGLKWAREMFSTSAARTASWRRWLKSPVNHVYSKPPGNIRTEIGQAAMTLEMLASHNYLDMDDEINYHVRKRSELTKEQWMARHKAKVDKGIAS